MNYLRELQDFTQLFQGLDKHIVKIVASDLLALTLVKPPGE